ncbi:MAG: nuclear transport factor 2 family protein [Ignavibacteriaceae bacterium]
MIKSKSVLLLSSLLIVLWISACKESGNKNNSLTDADLKALRIATKQYRDAEAGNDWETITKLYTDNAIRMLPKGSTIQGHEEILKEFKARPSKITEYDQKIIEVDGIGDIAFIRGIFSYTVDTYGKISGGTGKYIAIY